MHFLVAFTLKIHLLIEFLLEPQIKLTSASAAVWEVPGILTIGLAGGPGGPTGPGSSGGLIDLKVFHVTEVVRIV